MTNEERRQTIEKLDRLFCPVRLVCDGYRLTLVREPINPTTNRVLVYVDGFIRKESLTEDCEERRRFYCPHHSYVLSRRERDAIKKIGQRTLQKEGIDPDKQIIHFTPWWAISAQLVAHLEQNNREITLVKGKEEVTA